MSSGYFATKPPLNRAYSSFIRKIQKKKINVNEEQLEELKEAFSLFDTQHSGNVDAREYKAALRALGFETRKADVIKDFAEVGKEIDKTIDFEEFVKIVSPKLKNKNSREEIYKVFKLFDEDGKNRINFKNLRKIVQDLGEQIPDEELREMIEEADRDGDGLITPDDFYRVMRKNANDPLTEFDSDEDY